MDPFLNSCSLFSIFHHNVKFEDNTLEYSTKSLYEDLNKEDVDLSELSYILENSILSAIMGKKDSDISLTLTGGMDSRVILACLLKAGIKPNCVTYGNKDSRDVISAGNISKAYGLRFHNPVNKEPDKDWYHKWVVETIVRDNGDSNLHRAHRTAAISKHVQLFSPKILFTGHMGGEGLRGLTYNNYFASSFFEAVNEKNTSPIKAAEKVLKDCFLRYTQDDIAELIENISHLSWMKGDRETNKFFFLYDLVGKIHHTQEIRLYKTFIPKVVPVFLQKEYLEILFTSNYHFLNKPAGIAGRLQNPSVHCKLIEKIFPDLLDFPLSNGFSPREYLRGLWYYIPVKSIRNYQNRKKYRSSFSYGNWFFEYIMEQSKKIDKEIWEYFDKEKYMEELIKGCHDTDEGYWHKFSNPVFYDLVNKYKKGRLV